jgi:hypothetical protein
MQAYWQNVPAHPQISDFFGYLNLLDVLCEEDDRNLKVEEK